MKYYKRSLYFSSEFNIITIIAFISYHHLPNPIAQIIQYYNENQSLLTILHRSILPQSATIFTMHFPNRQGPNSRLTHTQSSINRTRTPVKSITEGTPMRKMKQLYKVEQTGQQSTGKQQQNVKYKCRDTMLLIQSLQDIYNNLNFNQFDAFPIDNIFAAKSRISQLYQYYKGQPICPKHSDLLNLYCEHDKEMVCVSCVYKGNNQHKNHKIKALETVEKVLDLQTIRNDEKCKSLVHQLVTIKQQIERMEKQVSEQYTMISNYTMKMYEEAITDLDALKREMEKKLNLAFRRTTTVISRYRQALQEMEIMIDSNIQRSLTVGSLSKHLILKSILSESSLIDELIGKFNQNKLLIEQWKRSSRQFQKSIVKKKYEPTYKVDTYIVTQF